MAKSDITVALKKIWEFLKIIWKDPVGSKVIAAIIIGLPFFLRDHLDEFFEDREKKVAHQEIREKPKDLKSTPLVASDSSSNVKDKSAELNKNKRASAHQAIALQKKDTVLNITAAKTKQEEEADFLRNSIPANGYTSRQNVFLNANSDTRKVKLLPVSIINYTPHKWQVVFGWVMLIWMYTGGIYFFSIVEDSVFDFINNDLLRLLLSFLFFLIMGGIWSSLVNCAFMHFFKWIPSTYAVYKSEQFLNWVLGWF